jgi:hypothetical protein
MTIGLATMRCPCLRYAQMVGRASQCSRQSVAPGSSMLAREVLIWPPVGQWIQLKHPWQLGREWAKTRVTASIHRPSTSTLNGCGSTRRRASRAAAIIGSKRPPCAQRNHGHRAIARRIDPISTQPRKPGHYRFFGTRPSAASYAASTPRIGSEHPRIAKSLGELRS